MGALVAQLEADLGTLQPTSTQFKGARGGGVELGRQGGRDFTNCSGLTRIGDCWGLLGTVGDWWALKGRTVRMFPVFQMHVVRRGTHKGRLVKEGTLHIMGAFTVSHGSTDSWGLVDVPCVPVQGRRATRCGRPPSQLARTVSR